MGGREFSGIRETAEVVTAERCNSARHACIMGKKNEASCMICKNLLSQRLGREDSNC